MVFLPLAFLGPTLFSQPHVFENGQPTLRGSDVGIHLDTPARQRIDLAGTWSYSLDNEKWNDVKVPSSFDYEGLMTFQRKVSVPEALLGSSNFKFVALGINYDAEVFINDIFIGKHTGGYTPVEFDIPDNVLQLGAENVLKVVVVNQLAARSTLPVRKQVWGWRNYGGILRDVFLVATPKLWIEGVNVRLEIDSTGKQGTFRVEATISNRDFAGLRRDSVELKAKPVVYSLQLEVYDKLSDMLIVQSPPVPLAIQSNRDHEARASVVLSAPKLWSPETPELYLLRTTITAVEGKQRIVVDQVARSVGFRRLELDQNDFVINRSKRKLKGVVWHEDSPSHGGSLTYEQMEKDIAQIKTLGANAVRFVFHPPHPYLINLCARYGLFALLEIPVWNVAADVLAEESFQLMTEATAKEMVEEFHDNPAVIAWGIGSDFDSADPRAILYVNRITKFVKSLDSRPVYFGSRMIENELASAGVDLAAVELPTRDLKSFKQLLMDWKKRHAGKPVIVISYGKEVEHANRNGWSDPMSQEAQARFFLQYYGVIKEVGVAGSFISSFADWKGDRPILTMRSSDPYIHPVGLMSYAREKRFAYDQVKVLYGEEKTSAIPVGQHRSSFPVAHIVAGLFVIIVGGYQYAYNRRFGEAVRRAFLRSYNFYADLRDSRAASVLHTLTLGGLISLTLGVMTSSILYHYRSDKLFDYLLTYFIVWDSVKELLVFATWNPLQGILGLTAVFFLGMWTFALLVRLCAVLVRTRVRWFHAYSVPVWGALPIIFLSPVAMSLFKVMENPMYVIPSLVLIAIFLLWAAVRIFAGISVIYDISPAKSYIGGIVVGAVVLGAVYFYYDSAFAIGSYLRFAMNVTRSLG